MRAPPGHRDPIMIYCGQSVAVFRAVHGFLKPAHYPAPSVFSGLSAVQVLSRSLLSGCWRSARHAAVPAAHEWAFDTGLESKLACPHAEEPESLP